MRLGMSEIVQRLCSMIGHENLRPSRSALGIAYDTQNGHWKIEFERGGAAAARALIVATGVSRAAQLLSGVSAQLTAALDEIPTESAVTVNLGYRKSALKRAPAGFGFIVPRSEAMNLIGCTFASVKFPGRAPEGAALLRAFAGGALGRRLFERDDDEIVDGVRRDLEPLVGVREAPILKSICRHAQSMPQYHIGHAARIVRIRAEAARFPGLRLAGNYFEGVGLPDCVREGEAAAESVVREFDARV
jgi:oxygen-dependent protoporphyrinogen oxidase